MWGCALFSTPEGPLYPGKIIFTRISVKIKPVLLFHEEHRFSNGQTCEIW